jgi:sporulation-control protein
MEIDRRSRGFAGLFTEAFDLDERYVRFDVTELNTDDLEGTIDEIIQSQIN